MSAQLFQILAQLDREGASEVVIATGRQVAVRVNGAYQTLTASAVTLPQLMHLIRETQLLHQIPSIDGVGDPINIDIDRRGLRAQFIKQGTDLMLRFEPRPPAQPAPRTSTTTPVTGTPIPRSATRPDNTSGSFAAIGRTITPRKIGSDTGVQTPVRTQTRSQPPGDPPTGERARLGSDRQAAIPRLVDEPSEVTPALAAIIVDARRRAASDLHIAANRPVLVRAVGELVAVEPQPKTPQEVDGLLMPLLGPGRKRQLLERGYVDLAVDVPGAGRIRGNVSRQQGGLKGAFRLALPRPPTLAELGLPQALAKVTENHQGLIVIAGPSGHGKTTTLAALVDLLNSADPIHILTVEDPVEIEHPRKAAVVSQREVGRHTLSFASALKASLREDPDVIVIGELRDRETVEIALTAAETGHLVLATMSTPSASKTIDRVIDMFPPDDQSQVRASLGASLKAIIAQRMLPNAEGTGMVVAVELLVGVLALANLIRDNKLYQLPNLMQRGRAFGMIRLDDSLLELVRAGRLDEELALRNADHPKELQAMLHPPAPDAKPQKTGLFGRKDRE